MPGSFHDARMFKESSLCRRIDQGLILTDTVFVARHNMMFPQVLLADKAYPVRKGLLPVYKNYTNISP